MQLCLPSCTSFERVKCHHVTGKDLNGPKRQRKHLARIQAFSDAALGTGSVSGAPPALALVRKLQAALASVEDLPAPAPSALPASASYRYYHSYSSSEGFRLDLTVVQTLAALVH